ncbi:MAG: lactate dehydrogenase [Betaproteobacteria bacterium RIFCSPLOWO2_12_FULL_62_58]|nr:MAG: lactate dehydrogenase [Betaproteobacteria bacterium RIFCSPLOWO2_12_FULL_62_58]
MSRSTIGPERLIDFAAAVYAGEGVPEPDARLLADTLVQADLWGHQSHGVLRLGWYFERLRNGVMKPVTLPEFVVDAGTVALIDGHDGVGQVLTRLATREAIKRAKAHGIGAVGVRNSNHFGTCMYYTLMGAREGCVTLLTTNGGPAMAPWGGRKKIVGTNPWSVAAPAGGRAPFVMDIATTGVARGKIYLARNKREPIPLGWAINAAGEPTTDPQEAIDGIILPMAGHKGYAIAAVVDLLSGVLTGSGFLSAVHSPYKTAEKSNCGHLMIAMNIEAFQPLAQFNERMEQFVAELKSVPLAQGHDEVFYPGEIEARSDARNRNDGLALPDDTRADLMRIARLTGLEAKLPF